MKSKKFSIRWVFVIAGIVVLVIVCWKHRSSPSISSFEPDQTVASLKRTPRNVVSSARISADRSSERVFASWRSELASLPESKAVGWLSSKLDSGADALTGQGFVPGPEGRMAQLPTYRLEWLEELGRRDPSAAADEAEKILASFTTPEEWAGALRWLARGHPEARALLEEKTRAFLRHESWRRSPTAAWLEAFDAAVYLGGTSLLPELMELARSSDNPPANHAAFLALDRLVQNDPLSVLAVLREDADTLAGREAMRGNMFARADVREVAQRQVIEQYLLAPGRAPAEVEAFADVFPNANFHVSKNLLTITRTPDAREQRLRDDAALNAVRAWRNDARFSALDPHLARVQRRLEEFMTAR